MRAIVFALSVLAVAQPGVVPHYEVYAVRFAHVPYAESSLVAGAAKGPQIDIAFTIWPIVDRAGSRVIVTFRYKAASTSRPIV